MSHRQAPSGPPVDSFIHFAAASLAQPAADPSIHYMTPIEGGLLALGLVEDGTFSLLANQSFQIVKRGVLRSLRFQNLVKAATATEDMTAAVLLLRADDIANENSADFEVTDLAVQTGADSVEAVVDGPVSIPVNVGDLVIVRIVNDPMPDSPLAMRAVIGFVETVNG